MTTHTQHHLTFRDRVQVPRSRGAFTGLLLILLGIWGGLVPFAGPALHYAFTPDNAWDLTWGRILLEVLPGAATVLGGLALSGSANRVSGSMGAWLGVAGGVWFVVGQDISRLWNSGVPQAGHPTSTSALGIAAEQIGYFTGLGVVIVFLAATALGRMSVVGVRDVRHRFEEPVAEPVHGHTSAREAETRAAEPRGESPVEETRAGETRGPVHTEPRGESRPRT